MASVEFPLMADEGSDDLPRTLRREREARERAAREKEAKARAATLTHDFGASDSRDERRATAEAFSGTVVQSALSPVADTRAKAAISAR